MRLSLDGPFWAAKGWPDLLVDGIIEETRQYIRDFDRLVETTTTARELYDQMLALYPARVNPGALWSSARAIKC